MIKVGVVYLITEKPEARGVLEEKAEIRRKTYCTEKSLSMNEQYQARAVGFAPDLRLKMAQGFEYKGETLCEYRGERYRIIRTYGDEKSDGIELTLERIRGNASAETLTEEDPETEDPENGTEEDPGTEGSGGDL